MDGLPTPLLPIPVRWFFLVVVAWRAEAVHRMAIDR